MKLCDDNRTYAFTNLNVKELMYITEDRKSFSGLIGDSMSKLFGPLHTRKCTLVGYPMLGRKDPKTGNYSGNLGLLQRGEASALLKLQTPLINEDWLKISIPIRNEEFRTVQELEEVQNFEKIDLFRNFFQFKQSLLGHFLGICLLYFFFRFLVILYKKNFGGRQMKLGQFVQKFAIVSLSSSSKYRIAVLSMLALFFEEFLWFSALVVTSSIKTDTVIVDTSDIIVDVDDAFNSKKTLCFYKDDIEHQIAISATKENTLRRLFEQKARVTQPIKGVKGEYCLIPVGLDNINLDTSKFFMISAYTHILVIGCYMNDLKPKYMAFISEPIYSINLHMYHIFKPHEEKFIQTLTYLYSENGLFNQVTASIRAKALILIRKRNRIYTSLGDYKTDASHLEHLSVENFENLFIYFFLVCSLLLLAFGSRLVCLKLARKFSWCLPTTRSLTNKPNHLTTNIIRTPRRETQSFWSIKQSRKFKTYFNLNQRCLSPPKYNYPKKIVFQKMKTVHVLYHPPRPHCL